MAQLLMFSLITHTTYYMDCSAWCEVIVSKYWWRYCKWEKIRWAKLSQFSRIPCLFASPVTCSVVKGVGQSGNFLEASQWARWCLLSMQPAAVSDSSYTACSSPWCKLGNIFHRIHGDCKVSSIWAALTKHYLFVLSHKWSIWLMLGVRLLKNLKLLNW